MSLYGTKYSKVSSPDTVIVSAGEWRTLRFSGCGFSRISSSSLKQLRVGNVFFRFGTSGLQEVVKAEEFAAEGAAVGGPFGLAGVDGKGGPGTPRLHRNFLKIALAKCLLYDIRTLG
jgi:hypothetical protein